MADTLTLSRRILLGAGLASALPLRPQAQTPPPPRLPLSFQIWRNGTMIGGHKVEFQGDDQDFVVAIEAHMLVKFGPIPVFRYEHQGQETWRGGRFLTLETHTTTNGRREQLTAMRSETGVRISTGEDRSTTSPAGAHPLTHWNWSVLETPLFNPQTGAAVHDAVVRSAGQSARLADGRAVPATRYVLSGQADITDWYDERGAWTGLRGKAPDGSFIDYRRVA